MGLRCKRGPIVEGHFTAGIRVVVETRIREQIGDHFRHQRWIYEGGLEKGSLCGRRISKTARYSLFCKVKIAS